MPLPLPNLDDRTFADLTLELRSLIHQYDKRWTNHNPSDLGITLIELVAWHAEILMYRMNRLEQRSYLGFLDLIGVQPTGAQVVMTFQLNILQAALPTTFVLPRGTRVCTRSTRNLAEIVFETLVDVPYQKGYWDADRSVWVFKAPAMNTKIVDGELLGISNGAGRQEFKVQQGRLFLDRGLELYAGNPQVMVEVGGIAGPLWRYKADLLSSGPSDEHFTADPLTGLLRFGDGEHGKIPPAGSTLRCIYRCVGDATGNVAARTIVTLLPDPPVGGISASSISVFNEYPAVGGTDSESLDDLLARGLASMQEPYRAVSDRDFEVLARQAAPEKITRATAVPDRNLERVPSDAEAHMSVIILPARTQLGLAEQPVTYVSATKSFTLNRTTVAIASALAAGTVARLKQDVLRFLDERRLITTIVHVVVPIWSSVGVMIEVQSKSGVNRDTLTQAVGEAMASFLDPYEGWADHRGWPYGRDLYRSELYQLIESLEGVDHVIALQMNGSATTSAIPVGDYHLVGLDGLAVTVT